MKFKYLSLALLISAIAAISSCKKSEIALSKKEMSAIVEKRNTQLGECFKSGNVERLALMYSDSAKLSPNGSNFIRGRDSIKAFWTEDFRSSKVIDMNTKVLTVDGNSEIIYETGMAYSKILYNDSLYHATVKYINVWRKQPNGEYLLDVDFWNKAK